MPEYFGIPGTLRSTTHGMLAPSNTAYRIYQLHYSMTSTATPAAALLYLCNATGTVTSTASPASIYITASYDQSIPVGVGNWYSSDGVYFPDGVFIQTPSNLVYYTLVYTPISSNR